MANTIKIGTTPLKDISAEDLLQVAVIEGVHSFFEAWNQPYVTEIDKRMFSDTIVLEYEQTRIKDGIKNKKVVFYFDFKRIGFFWHHENEEYLSRKSDRLRIESIKFLLQKGYDLPIY